MTWTPTEPNADQCTNRAPVPGPYSFPAYALWYPQMGGYVSKCVAVPETQPPLDEEDDEPCWTVYVWHDGTFPFHADYEREARSPTELHHCSAEQFITFGETLTDLARGANSAPPPIATNQSNGQLPQAIVDDPIVAAEARGYARAIADLRAAAESHVRDDRKDRDVAEIEASWFRVAATFLDAAAKPHHDGESIP